MEIKRIIIILEKTIRVLETSPIELRSICDTFHYLLSTNAISFEEYRKINVFINDNKPSFTNEFKEFTKNRYWNCNPLVLQISYWWKTIYEAPETQQIRIDYLRKLINNLK